MAQYIKKLEYYSNLIYSMAWEWSAKTGIDFYEFLSEGNMIYLDAKRLFNPEKNVKFSTFLRIKLNWGMSQYFQYCEKYKSNNLPYEDQEIIDEVASYNPDWNMMIDDLSTKAKDIIDLIRTTPHVFYENCMKTKHEITQNVIRKYLVGLGWSNRLITECFDEIREELCV